MCMFYLPGQFQSDFPIYELRQQTLHASEAGSVEQGPPLPQSEASLHEYP